jgi:hypothetical protein
LVRLMGDLRQLSLTFSGAPHNAIRCRCRFASS